MLPAPLDPPAPRVLAVLRALLARRVLLVLRDQTALLGLPVLRAQRVPLELVDRA